MKNISHPALIKGVFRELAALRRTVHIASDGGTGPARIAVKDDLSRSSSDSFHIEILDLPLSTRSLQIQFELDGVLYSCVLNAATDSQELLFCVPSTLEPDQRRKAYRADLQTLGKDPLLVEVRGRAYRHYGYLKDSNQHFLTAKLSVNGRLIQIGDIVGIRAYTRDAQVLTTAARVSAVRPSTANGAVEVLLELHHASATKHKIRPGRTVIEPLTHLEAGWPDESGLRIRLQVVETGPTGFSARIVGNQPELPPKGAICKIEGGTLFAQVQWISDDRLGFDLSINDRSGLALWTTWVDEWRLKVLTRTPLSRQQSRIASVLIRSGYLRDFKASVFSSTPQLVSLIPNNHLTRAWLCRFLRGTATEIDAHVSFARCSDSSWIIQELGNCAVETRIGDSLLTESIEAFYMQESPYQNYGSTMIALFDPQSKFNQRFWICREDHDGLSSHKCALVGLEQVHEQLKPPTHTAIELTHPSIAAWPSEWGNITQWADERTLYGLGLRSDDFKSPSLRQDLSRSGYRLERHTVLLKKAGQIIGLAIVMGVPTFSNLNATSNHLWLYLKDGKDWREVFSALTIDQPDPAFHGITESVVFFQEGNAFETLAESLGKSVRPRSLYFLPVHTLLGFLHSTGTEQNESA